MVSASEKPRKMRPALTPEARENQLIALAMDAAEEQLRNGTASAQVITHYLKLGSSKEKLEKEMMARQNELLEAKTEAMKAAQQSEAIYKEAIEAFRRYSGQTTDTSY